MILPFPFGLVAALAIFIAFPLFLRKRYMNRMRGYGGESERRRKETNTKDTNTR